MKQSNITAELVSRNELLLPDEPLGRRIARRLSVFSLAILLFLVAGGLGYVAFLTEQTAQHIGVQKPSMLPLLAMAVVSAVIGWSVLRVAVGAEDGDGMMV